MWISQYQNWSTDVFLTSFWPFPKCFHGLLIAKGTHAFLPLVSPAWIILGTIVSAHVSVALVQAHSGPLIGTLGQADNTLYELLMFHLYKLPCCHLLIVPTATLHLPVNDYDHFQSSTCPTISKSIKISLILCSTDSLLPKLFTVLFSLPACVTYSLCSDLVALMLPLPIELALL